LVSRADSSFLTYIASYRPCSMVRVLAGRGRARCLAASSQRGTKLAFFPNALNPLSVFLPPFLGIFQTKQVSQLHCSRVCIEAHSQESQRRGGRRYCRRRIWRGASLYVISHACINGGDSIIRTHIIVAILHQESNPLTSN